MYSKKECLFSSEFCNMFLRKKKCDLEKKLSCLFLGLHVVSSSCDIEGVLFYRRTKEKGQIWLVPFLRLEEKCNNGLGSCLRFFTTLDFLFASFVFHIYAC